MDFNEPNPIPLTEVSDDEEISTIVPHDAISDDDTTIVPHCRHPHHLLCLVFYWWPLAQCSLSLSPSPLLYPAPHLHLVLCVKC